MLLPKSRLASVDYYTYRRGKPPTHFQKMARVTLSRLSGRNGGARAPN